MLHFGVGQRALGRLERQPDRQAHRARRHALALVPIEHAQRGERRRHVAAGRQNGATNDFRRQGIRDDDGEVADDEGVPRQRPRRVADRDARALEQIEVGLGDVDRVLAWQAARVDERRRELADETGARAVLRAAGDDDRRRPAVDQERFADRLDANRHTQRVAQMLGRALDVEEVDLTRAARPVLALRGAGPRERDAARLAGRREARADLEQLDVAPAVAPVVRDGVDQPREQRRPQRVELPGQRICDRDTIGKNRGDRGDR